MPLESSKETVAILYDIENAPFEMLNFTLSKARRYKNCRTIVVSDWDERPDQKRWEKLLRRPGFTFRQISRTYEGKNSLDSAIYDSAKILYQEGVRKFFIITTDSDFVRIAELLNSETPSYIIGVGTKQASETLRNAYNEFFVYPPEDKKKAKAAKKEEKAVKEKKDKANKNNEGKAEKAEAKEEKVSKKGKKSQKKTLKVKSLAEEIQQPQAVVKPEPKQAKAAEPVEKTAVPETANKKAKAANKKAPNGALTISLPKSLRAQLEKRQQEEGVTMNELLTYLITRGLSL